MNDKYNWIFKDEEFQNATLSNRIKLLCRANGYTQKQLALRSGCTEATISWCISGKHTPRKSTLKKLATALGVSVNELAKGGK